MIRLFATDLDQTLLVENRIPPENRKALQELQARGVAVCFTSGRVVSSIDWLAKEAGLSVAIVGSNGAIAVDETGAVQYERPIPEAAFDALVDIGERRRLHYHFYNRDTFITSHLDPRAFSHLLVEEDRRGKAYQCNILIQRDLHTLRGTIQALKVQYVTAPQEEEAVCQELEALAGIAVTQSAPCLIEAMCEGVDKWHGIENLARSLGIRPEEIAVCGDYLNDRMMIENAGWGVAVDNAMDAVKEVADYITDSCRNFGVARAVEELIRRNWVPERIH